MRGSRLSAGDGGGDALGQGGGLQQDVVGYADVPHVVEGRRPDDPHRFETRAAESGPGHTRTGVYTSVFPYLPGSLRIPLYGATRR